MRIFGLEIWHNHKWQDHLVENFYDTSFGGNWRRTSVVQKCSDCGKYKHTTLDWWIPEFNTKRTNHRQDRQKKQAGLKVVK